MRRFSLIVVSIFSVKRGDRGAKCDDLGVEYLREMGKAEVKYEGMH